MAPLRRRRRRQRCGLARRCATRRLHPRPIPPRTNLHTRTMDLIIPMVLIIIITLPLLRLLLPPPPPPPHLPTQARRALPLPQAPGSCGVHRASRPPQSCPHLGPHRLRPCREPTQRLAVLTISLLVGCRHPRAAHRPPGRQQRSRPRRLPTIACTLFERLSDQRASASSESTGGRPH